MRFIKWTAGQDARIQTQSCQHVFGNSGVDDSSIKPPLRSLATKLDCDKGSFRDFRDGRLTCASVLAYWRTGVLLLDGVMGGLVYFSDEHTGTDHDPGTKPRWARDLHRSATPVPCANIPCCKVQV